MKDLKEYSLEELKSLEESISSEINRRAIEQLPYEEGDYLFYDGGHKGFDIIYIKEITGKHVKVDIIKCYNTLSIGKVTHDYDIELFLTAYPKLQPIDPLSFSLFSRYYNDKVDSGEAFMRSIRQLVKPNGRLRAAIFSIPIPRGWRFGQFVFNRAVELYGNVLVRSLSVDCFYNDDLVDQFIDELAKNIDN